MPRPEAAVSKPAQPVEPQTDLPTTEELPSLAPELKQAEVGSPDSPASLFSESTADMEKPKTGPTLFDSNATASSGSSEKVADLFGGSRVESFMEPGDAFSASSKNRNETEDGVTSIFDLYSVDPSTRQTNSGYREANPFAVGGIEEKKTESDSLGTPSFAIRESANAATQDEALAEEDHSTDVGDSPRALASQHFENGLASVRAGRLEEALQDWQSALKLDPDNRVYKMNIKKLMERMEREAN
jgi:tetratricopeptide (TPR) repeat protein